MITTLSQLIAQTESANKVDALRLEPAYHPSAANIQRCLAAHKKQISLSTAEMICRTSWGLYQIMGDNIYSMGFTAPILEYWKDPEIQLDFFKRYCLRANIDYTLAEVLNEKNKRDNFAKRYNGSLIYSDRLLKIYNDSTSL